MKTIFDSSGNVVGYIGDNPGCCIAITLTGVALAFGAAQMAYTNTLFGILYQVASIFTYLFGCVWLAYIAFQKIQERSLVGIFTGIGLGLIAFLALCALLLFVGYGILIGAITL